MQYLRHTLTIYANLAIIKKSWYSPCPIDRRSSMALSNLAAWSSMKSTKNGQGVVLAAGTGCGSGDKILSSGTGCGSGDKAMSVSTGCGSGGSPLYMGTGCGS